ncbi:MAG: Exonuclease SbcC, partial [Labilithrix sp.]|nr:Exonuclease SbcC [Labilithrix sp.]
ANRTSQRPPPPAPTPPPRLIAPIAPNAPNAPNAPPTSLAETGERSLADLFPDLAGKPPSVTLQVASPSVPPEAYVPDSEAATLSGTEGEGALRAFRNESAASDASINDSGALTAIPSVADAPTISTRDLERAATFDSETVIADRKRPSFSDADTATRHPDERDDGDVRDAQASTAAQDERLPADDEAPTFMRPSVSPAPATFPSAPPERERPSATDGPAEVDRERPSRWLDAETTTSFRQRASWLEEEARALADATDRARALLGVSELLALVGDEAEAFALATEARDLAPDLALAWRQARQLMAPDAGALAEALDAEAARSPTPAARAHAMLMAADVLRTNGDGDGAVERWNSACKLDPADVRAPAARAALALAQGNHTSAGTDLAENSELIALDKAVAMALKLRGAPRPGTDVEATPINDGLRRARTALVANDVVTAAQAVADVSAEPALSKAALWLSAAFGATHIAGRRGAAKALRTLANEGESLARRQLAARGIELGDPDLVIAALTDDAPVEIAERTTLLALAGQHIGASLDSLAALTNEPAYAPLVDALSAITPASDEALAVTRSQRAAGTEEHRALAALGRLLASKPKAVALDDALDAVALPRGPAAAGVALEAAVRTQRWNEVSDALSSLPTGDDANAAWQRHVAAALVAERADNRENAARAWREALTNGASHDSVVRALAGLDPELDLAGELLRIADDMPDGPPGALLRLEALARRDAATAAGDEERALDDAEQSAILERVHRGAPTLGIGSFLAERIGRRKGDVDEVLRWIQERRSYANDSFETALDAVREALLVADRDADLASTRLEEAHRARPDDLALRELYERLATEPPADRGTWRERRAEKTSGATRALLYTEA